MKDLVVGDGVVDVVGAMVVLLWENHTDQVARDCRIAVGDGGKADSSQSQMW